MKHSETPLSEENNIDEFVKMVRNHLNGEDLRKATKDADQRFFNSIKSGVMQFGLADQNDERGGRVTKTANEFMFSTCMTSKDLRLIIVSIDHRENHPSRLDTPYPSPGGELALIFTGMSASRSQSYLGPKLILGDLRKEIDRYRARELPGNSREAQDALSRRAIEGWPVCAMNYFEELSTLAAKCLDEVSRIYFGRDEESGSFPQVR